ncbi:MAG: serine--tRNA ligase [Planctomycetes bacterium]|nr:serine--tRNA ligase [Planctomycetota bacterium]
MIDLKQLRENPDRFRAGAKAKKIEVDIDALLELDTRKRALMAEQESKRAEQNKISKEIGPQIGKLRGSLKKASDTERPGVEAEIKILEEKPSRLKAEIQGLDQQIAEIDPRLNELLLKVPLPPDPDVPAGESENDNVELRTWNPDWFDPKKSFRENKGFDPKSHIDLIRDLKLVDFERAVKIAGARHYVFTGDGMRLQQAVLRFAFDFVTNEHGFTPMSVPVIVREECMVGTGFFPTGRDQAYCVSNLSGFDMKVGHRDQPVSSTRVQIKQDGERIAVEHTTSYPSEADATPDTNTGYRPLDGWLTGTGEVGLMGLHADEIIDADQLPLQYATVSTCFRREAGAAGKDTAGLYRVHQFDKVEQVVICRADEAESRAWHKKMIGIVEELMQKLELPYRLLQCCTADLGPKNADMIDIEGWMPSRGDVDANGIPQGAYGETHSASRLYDYQCRRLNLRYRGENGKTVFCHSLNNTVAATPRILIPILEMYQNEDGSVTVPEVLRAYMGGRERIG